MESRRPTSFAAPFPSSAAQPGPTPAPMGAPAEAGDAVRLFLAGDVMLGRGIDQIMPHSVKPVLKEPAVRDAGRYVELARSAGADIPDRVDVDYVWGDALFELGRHSPAYRIVNLETSITTSSDFSSGKRIHYRMHPENARALGAAEIDACVLANNHVMDFGTKGLRSTLSTLESRGIQAVGAGRNQSSAEAPAVFDLQDDRRLILFAFASATSGVPPTWAATAKRPGVSLLPPLASGDGALDSVATEILSRKRPGGLVVVSLHWGANWGYEVAPEEQVFARGLIDSGAADIVYGHSSHHPRPIEVYHDRLILYGCGDLLNDYEGIPGHEEFRPNLSLLYFPLLDLRSGRLRSLTMTTMRIEGFRLTMADASEAEWMAQTLSRESDAFGVAVRVRDDQRLVLEW